MVKQEIIESIRLYKARGLDIGGISQAVNMTVDEVRKVISEMYKNTDLYTEIISSIDTYSVMINDVNLMIYELREKGKLNSRREKRLMDLFNQRQRLQDAKVKLLTDILPDSKSYTVKQVDLSAYESLESKNKQYYPFIYKIIAVLSQIGFTKKNLKKIDKKTRKLIRKTVGLTKEEYKECLKLIKTKEIPMPTSSVEIRLRKMWL